MLHCRLDGNTLSLSLTGISTAKAPRLSKQVNEVVLTYWTHWLIFSALHSLCKYLRRDWELLRRLELKRDDGDNGNLMPSLGRQHWKRVASFPTDVLFHFEGEITWLFIQPYIYIFFNGCLLKIPLKVEWNWLPFYDPFFGIDFLHGRLQRKLCMY